MTPILQAREGLLVYKQGKYELVEGILYLGLFSSLCTSAMCLLFGRNISGMLYLTLVI
jgi:hypothetical protein